MCLLKIKQDKERTLLRCSFQTEVMVNNNNKKEESTEATDHIEFLICCDKRLKMMGDTREQQVTFTKSEGSAGSEGAQTFVFFWERLILSPRLKAIPCETKEKNLFNRLYILTDSIHTRKSIKL